MEGLPPFSGSVVENPPSNAGDVGSIPGLGTKIQHATGKLESPCAATRKACGLQERPVQPKEKEKRKLGGLKKKKSSMENSDLFLQGQSATYDQKGP